MGVSRGRGPRSLCKLAPISLAKRLIFCFLQETRSWGAILFLFWGLGPGHLTSCRAGLGWPGLGGDGEEGHKREEGQKSKK